MRQSTRVRQRFRTLSPGGDDLSANYSRLTTIDSATRCRVLREGGAQLICSGKPHENLVEQDRRLAARQAVGTEM